MVGTQEDSIDSDTHELLTGEESDDEIIERIFACEDGLLFVMTDDGVVWLRIIVGNGCGEIVSDYVAKPHIDSVMNLWIKEMS